MSNSISDAAIMAALGRQMTQAVDRQSVAAGNLANLDTPGYHAREVSFEDTLADTLSGGTGNVHLAATNVAHAGAAATTPGDTVQEAAGLPERRDGNNVQLDRELLSMTKAGIDFSEAQTVMAAKFRLVRYAINDGR